MNQAEREARSEILACIERMRAEVIEIKLQHYWNQKYGKDYLHRNSKMQQQIRRFQKVA